ncbi:MAG: elongation factor P [bacterium]|nr:elongation factor P [bacterium]
MPTIDPGKLRPGHKIVLDDQLWVVTDWQLRTPGNLRSFVVCKVKNLADGRVIEKTFRGSADWPQQADVATRTCQYLYNDDMGFHFMDMASYDQFALAADFIGAQANYLIPDAEVQVAYWNDKPIGLELPLKMAFRIVDTVDEVARGNSSGNITKDATLETGLTIQVPSFIKNGEKVLVNTETGLYVERA